MVCKILAPSFGQQPSHDDVAEDAGDEDIDDHEDADAEDDRSTPVRLAAEGLVAVIHIFFGGKIVPFESFEGFEVVVATILEDVLLDAVILGHGELVQFLGAVGDALVVFLVQLDVLQHRDVVVAQGGGGDEDARLLRLAHHIRKSAGVRRDLVGVFHVIHGEGRTLYGVYGRQLRVIPDEQHPVVGRRIDVVDEVVQKTGHA